MRLEHFTDRGQTVASNEWLIINANGMHYAPSLGSGWLYLTFDIMSHPLGSVAIRLQTYSSEHTCHRFRLPILQQYQHQWPSIHYHRYG